MNPCPALPATGSSGWITVIVAAAVVIGGGGLVVFGRWRHHGGIAIIAIIATSAFAVTADRADANTCPPASNSSAPTTTATSMTGAPIARDDFVTAPAGAGGVVIDVTANDDRGRPQAVLASASLGPFCVLELLDDTSMLVDTEDGLLGQCTGTYTIANSVGFSTAQLQVDFVGT
jgi:LPXTG-motif cell wall-anchored protein